MVGSHKLAALSEWNPMSWEGMCCWPCHTLSSNRKKHNHIFWKGCPFLT